MSDIHHNNVGPVATMNGGDLPLLTVSPVVSTGGDQSPDQDTIKMFVGQVPRSMDENDLSIILLKETAPYCSFFKEINWIPSSGPLVDVLS